MPETTTCERCGAPCQVAPRIHPDARMLKRSTVLRGVCVNCAVTAWLKNTYPVNMLIYDSPHGPQVLLVPHIQQQFVAIMYTGNADARPQEINWQHVVDHWALPTLVTRTAQNPWLPTDPPAPRRRRAEDEAHQVAEGDSLLRDLGMTVTRQTETNIVLRRGQP